MERKPLTKEQATELVEYLKPTENMTIFRLPDYNFQMIVCEVVAAPFEESAFNDFKAKYRIHCPLPVIDCVNYTVCIISTQRVLNETIKMIPIFLDIFEIAQATPVVGFPDLKSILEKL